MQRKKARAAAGAAAAAVACLLGVAVPRPAEAAAHAPAVVTDVPCGASALAAAMNSASSGDTLSLAAGCAYRQAALPEVTINLAIAGNGATLVDSNLEVDNNILTVTDLNFRRSRLLVEEIGAATVTGGTFTGGTTSGSGGAIDDEGAGPNFLFVSGATFIGNTAGGDGGAIVGAGTGVVEVSGCTFIGNRAGDAGGAVALNPDGASYLSDLVMRDNSAMVGGAIANYAIVVIEDSLITGNNASGAGGGIYSGGGGPGQLELTGSVLGQNTAPQGAAIYNDNGGTAGIASTTIAHNDASVSGGGIYNNGLNDGTVTLTDSRISYNQADAMGGGIYSGPGGVVASGTVISRNTATAGGGIYDGGGGTVVLTASPVVYNTPDNCEPAGSAPGCTG
jgi:predicted outer membrane repeat protein